MSLKITVFSDFICPFCYIGIATMRKLRPEFDLEIDWRGFEIHPEWPREGIADERIFRGDPEQRKASWARIESMAAAAGIAMKPRRTLINSHLALLAGEYANEAGCGSEFEARVYRGYFEEESDIGDVGFLKQCARDAGLDPSSLDDALVSQKYELKLKNNQLIGQHRGVTGVPTFFIGEFPLVGAQSEETIRAILTRVTERIGAQV